jgi:hypothetical protein
MFKCCGIRKLDPLNSQHRGTLNIRMERPELLLVLSSTRGEIERVFVIYNNI